MDNMEQNDVFLEELNSILSIKTDYDSKDYNYTWIEIYEDVIIRNDLLLKKEILTRLLPCAVLVTSGFAL